MADEEWTLAIGLRRAAVYLLIWSLISAAIWIGTVYAAAPLLAQFRTRAFLIPSAALGAFIGWMLVRNLSETAGFSGWILAFLASACAFTIIIGGINLVAAYRPIDGHVIFMIGGAACLTALAIVVMLTLRDG